MMSIPIAIIINDTHLHKNNIDQVKDIFGQVLDVSEEIDVDTIIHGGDFFTNRIGQPQSVLLAAQEISENIIHKYGKNFHIVPGNHDKTDNEAFESYLDIYNYWEDQVGGFQVHKEYFCINKEKVDMWILPYFKENGSNYFHKLKEINELVDENKYNILVTHIGVNGAKNNDYSEVRNNITHDLFYKFDQVLIGHYHNYQKVTNKIWYTGSTHPQNFGEDNDKGYTIVYDDGSWKRFNLNFPHYLKYTHHPNEITNDVLSKLQTEAQTNFVRVVLRGKQSEVKSFDKGILEDIGVDVKSEIEEVQQNIESANNFKVHNVSSIQEEFSKFAEGSEIKDDKVKKEKEYLKQIEV